jgi:glycosyltransferase involved in cell wall biosynthesis
MQSSAKKKTYLFVLPWPLNAIGGVNQVVINLAREMEATNEILPLVLIHEWDATHPIFEDVHGIKTVRWRIRSYHEDMGLKDSVMFCLWRFRFAYKFRKFCNDHSVVAVNLHFPGLQAFAIERVLKGLSRKIPLILSFHGSDVGGISSASKMQTAQWGKLLSNSNNKVVVCSNDLGKRLVDAAGCDIPYFVIYNGLNVDSFCSMADESTSDGDRMILNVGKFDERKGQDVLINAFSEIASKYKNVKLVLVGGTGKALPRLKALCVEKGIDNSVEFYPDIPHRRVSNFYKKATIFCFPSRREPFGIVLLEAASFSVPVIASRVGGIPELVSDGENGVLVTQDDHMELAHCIKALLDDPVAAQKMGERLSEHVKSNFSWASAFKKYLDLLENENAERQI